MPADDEAPREGELDAAVEVAEDAEKAEAEKAEAGAEGEGVAPEQPADDAAGQAAPTDGDGERE
jgi:hypothetical protein